MSSRPSRQSRNAAVAAVAAQGISHDANKHPDPLLQ
jgi:hypothetical protein